MKNELVSIVIPFFNNENYIEETLLSVQCQTYKYWEAICVDDGSSDNSCKIINNYIVKDSRFRLVHRSCSTKGGSVCRNIGLNEARGKYVIFLDGDDILAPYCLENRIELISKSSCCFAVFPNGLLKNGVFTGATSDKRIKHYLMAYASNHAVWQTTCPIYKTEFVRGLNGFDESYPRLQDVEFNTRCIAAADGNFMVFLDQEKPDCYYRVCDSAIAFSKKYDLAYSTVPKLADLSRSLFFKGKLSKKEYSKVCLAIVCSMIMIRRFATNKSRYWEMAQFDIKSYMSFTDKLLLNLLDSTERYDTIYYHFAHGIKFLTTHIYF